MSWSTKEKAFCVEAYFANNSYKVVEASFRRISAIMLHQKAEFLIGFKSLESMGLCKFSAIPKEECVRVIDNFARRMQVCLQSRGGHLVHILERT